MATRSITLTVEAYDALKARKAQGESFSETILRIAKRKPLSACFGVLGAESGARLEQAVLELRVKRARRTS